MSTERAVIAAAVTLALALLATGCGQPSCLRNSDCPQASTCSPAGVCESDVTAIDAADDATDDAALDAALDAAIDAEVDAATDALDPDAGPPPQADPVPEPAPPILTAYDAGTDAPPFVDPTLDLPAAIAVPPVVKP